MASENAASSASAASAASPGGAGTPVWSSRFATYLATIGAAVGLGSIWRLPYLVGTGGGSAFLFVFVLACLAIATPLLTAEFALGRRSRESPPDAAGKVAVESGRSRRWNAIGILGTIAAFAIVSYYTVIAGWVLAYTWKCATGALSGLSRPAVATLWHEFLSRPLELGAWHIAFLAIVAFISARGVSRGIELATRVRAPTLLLLLLILAGYALTHGDARAGIAFAFAPNFAAMTPQVFVAAVGQAFFATGVGMAMMLAYGAYMPRGASLVRSALLISGSILLVSLLATLTIFPLVFRYGMNPAGGSELVFDVLATVFAEMPGGRLVGTLFFFLLTLSALTPSIAALEPLVAWLKQHRGVSRGTAVAIATATAWAMGVGSLLSFNLASNWHPLSWLPFFAGKNFFEIVDYVASNVLLPVGALMTTVFVGWRMRREILDDELRETTSFARRVSFWLLRWFCPIALLVVLISTLR
ncbi:MAG: sodium-dependent transporter [Thermoanaerobaculia bacterium]